MFSLGHCLIMLIHHAALMVKTNSDIYAHLVTVPQPDRYTFILSSYQHTFRGPICSPFHFSILSCRVVSFYDINNMFGIKSQHIRPLHSLFCPVSSYLLKQLASPAANMLCTRERAQRAAAALKRECTCWMMSLQVIDAEPRSIVGGGGEGGCQASQPSVSAPFAALLGVLLDSN